MGVLPGGGFLVDSSGHGFTLTNTGATQVASTAGAAFGDAAQIASTQHLAGPAGAANGNGTVTGTAFTVECFFLCLTDANTFNIIQLNGSFNAWAISWDGAHVTFEMWDASGVGHTVTSAALVNGTTYHLAMTWNGATLTGWVAGASAGTAAMASAQATTAAYFVGIGSAGAVTEPTTQVDEIRISSIARYTAPFVPPTAEFATDANTGALYHFDTTTYGATVNLAGWEEVIIVEAPASSTPTVTDANGIAYPVTVVAAGGLWWAPIPSANGTPLTVSTSATGTAVLKSKNPYLG